MRKRGWIVLGCLTMLGCKGGEKTAQVPSDPAFDHKWVEIAQRGADPLVIESDVHGAGLMGEFRRATAPASDTLMLKPGTEVKGELPDDQVLRVIRANLPAVKSCYQVAEREGVGAGKAIVSFEIEPSGSVTSVNVDAPAFRSSTLPGCMSGRARAWQFPKFTQGPKRFSYPFVFVGG